MVFDTDRLVRENMRGSFGSLSQLGNKMTAIPGFPLGTIYQITDITQDMPGVVTLSDVALPNSFAIENGMTITISKVIGMFQVNDQRYIIGGFDSIAKTFRLYSLSYKPIDTSRYTPYISGGEINIISYPATATNPPGLMYNNQ
jgi:hypothetical protein